MAISQAGAYILHCSSLKKYIELYQEHRDKLLQTKVVQGQDQYELAVYATWKLSYDKLGSSARILLQILSFLHHEGITEEIFKRAALSKTQLENSDLQLQVTKLLMDIGRQDASWNSWLFQRLIGDIMSYSLVEFDNRDQSYSIHPLAQHCCTAMLGQDQFNQQKCVLSILGLSISWSFNMEDYKYRRRLLQHITMAKRGFNAKEISDLLAENIALVYSEQGQWKEAEALQVVVMEKRKDALGEEHPDTLSSMANLAGTYKKQGQWKEAEALEVVVMEKRKDVLGEEHPDTLSSMANLAGTYRNQGQWKEAEALEVVVMEKRKDVLGEQHPDTLSSMGAL